MSEGWARVTKSKPCKICGKPDWCAVGTWAANCMRVQSDHPCKNGGWIHRLGKEVAIQFKPAIEEPETPAIDARSMMLQFWNDTTESHRLRLAQALGVSVIALRCLGVAWAAEHNAWAIPMFDGNRNCIGIRLRADNGQKWAVKGSKQGIFLPKVEHGDTAFIVEGPTDTAAALSLNLFAIGRPSCNGCISYTQVAINRLGIKQAILVADNDNPGIRGAKQLADELQVPCCSMLLPCKDLRAYLALGGDRRLLDSLKQQLVWHQPS